MASDLIRLAGAVISVLCSASIDASAASALPCTSAKDCNDQGNAACQQKRKQDADAIWNYAIAQGYDRQYPPIRFNAGNCYHEMFGDATSAEKHYRQYLVLLEALPAADRAKFDKAALKDVHLSTVARGFLYPNEHSRVQQLLARNTELQGRLDIASREVSKAGKLWGSIAGVGGTIASGIGGFVIGYVLLPRYGEAYDADLGNFGR